MAPHSNLIGYVQAGGGSTRFGSDKSLALLEGKTMLARTVDLVASVCPVTAIVALSSRYPGAPAPVVEDRWPGQGPLGGVLTALYDGPLRVPTAAPDSYALIVSCDMPFLTRDWLAFLCARALQRTAQVVVPQSGLGMEPLCACWRLDAVGPLRAAFDSGVRKMTEAMKTLSVEVLDESVWKRFDTHGRLFWNLNTAADYREALRMTEASEP